MTRTQPDGTSGRGRSSIPQSSNVSGPSSHSIAPSIVRLMSDAEPGNRPGHCAATRVVGVDRSHPMLSEAARHGGLAFVVSRSEELPFVSRSVNLATVALAFHWFQQDRFLPEAHRVLRAGGWLGIVRIGHVIAGDNRPDDLLAPIFMLLFGLVLFGAGVWRWSSSTPRPPGPGGPKQ